MELLALGVNGPFPAADGYTSGYLLTCGETHIGMDLGAGTLGRLTRAMAPEKLDALLLSHWHFDHASDILPLLYRLQSCADRPLKVYAPVDESSPIRQTVLADGMIELHDVKPGDSVTIGACKATFFAARHPVPAVMIRVTDGDRTLCYTGDTNEVEGLDAFAEGAGLLLADGLFTDALWAFGKPHLSARKAAALAAAGHVGQLVITHLNPAIDPARLLKEAREEYPAAQLAQAGRTWHV